MVRGGTQCCEWPLSRRGEHGKAIYDNITAMTSWPNRLRRTVPNRETGGSSPPEVVVLQPDMTRVGRNVM